MIKDLKAFSPWGNINNFQLYQRVFSPNTVLKNKPDSIFKVTFIDSNLR